MKKYSQRLPFLRTRDFVNRIVCFFDGAVNRSIHVFSGDGTSQAWTRVLRIMFRVFGNSVNRNIHLEIHVFSTTKRRRKFLTKKKNNERLCVVCVWVWSKQQSSSLFINLMYTFIYLQAHNLFAMVFTLRWMAWWLMLSWPAYSFSRRIG